jgi:hypothetical protein
MRTAAAALLYCVLVFAAGFLLGPIRVLWLEPKLGPFLAVLCEMPFLIAAMVFAARWVPRVVSLAREPQSLILMGLGALALLQAADIAVGVGLRGLTLSAQFAQFATPQGVVYAAALVAFAAMPVIVNRR